MEKIDRTPAPAWLKEKEDEWGKTWKEKYEKTGKSSDFCWRRHKKQGHKDLVEELSAMTHRHCSFCDAYPMEWRIKSTIEHFKPKTRFPLEAYKWENLFLCCSLCQEKGDEYDEKLLKPDDDLYEFDRFFEIDWITGELNPSRFTTPEYRERAQITIELYRLNGNGKPDDRKEELEKYASSDDINKCSYRFFLKRGCLDD